MNDFERLKSRGVHIDAAVAYFSHARRAAIEKNQSLEIVEHRSNLFLMDALGQIARDIDDSANKLSRDIERQTVSIESMETQMRLIKSQMDLGRDYFMRQKLQVLCGKPEGVKDFKTVTANVAVASSSPSKEQLTSTEIPSRPDDFLGGYDLLAPPRMAHRIQSYEDIGVCLHDVPKKVVVATVSVIVPDVTELGKRQAFKPKSQKKSKSLKV